MNSSTGFRQGHVNRRPFALLAAQNHVGEHAEKRAQHDHRGENTAGNTNLLHRAAREFYAARDQPDGKEHTVNRIHASLFDTQHRPLRQFWSGGFAQIGVQAPDDLLGLAAHAQVQRCHVRGTARYDRDERPVSGGACCE